MTADETTPTADGIRLPRPTSWWAAILAALLVGTSLSYGLHSLRREPPLSAKGPVASAATARESPITLGPKEIIEGPWGRLEITPITISPPPELLDPRLYYDQDEIAWHFPNTSLSQLGKTLAELGLADSLAARIGSLATLNKRIRGYTVRPPEELVLGLSPQDRAKLYILLQRMGGNSDHRDGFQFCGSSTDQWFGDVPLSPETRRLVTSLIYRHRSFMFFSDLRIARHLLPSDEEAMLLMKAVTRESTLRLKLRISHASDVESLINYWGRGGRQMKIRPILEALAKLPGEQSLDVAHLLPPFAGQRIYTYPTVSGKASRSVQHDCHWTALSFFSHKPDDRYGRANKAFAAFNKAYCPVSNDQGLGNMGLDDPELDNLGLGDLIVYNDDQGRLIHTAVYIAAGVVFTKNGSGAAHPWMFLKLENMDDYYPAKGLKRTFYTPRES